MVSATVLEASWLARLEELFWLAWWMPYWVGTVWLIAELAAKGWAADPYTTLPPEGGPGGAGLW